MPVGGGKTESGEVGCAGTAAHNITGRRGGADAVSRRGKWGTRRGETGLDGGSGRGMRGRSQPWYCAGLDECSCFA